MGAGAKILGGFTVGDNARIGSNAVVVREVPENVTVVGVPARSTKETKKQREQLHSQFMAYGVVPGEDDPYVVKIRQLERQLQQQAQMIAQLQKLAGIDGEEKNEEKGAETEVAVVTVHNFNKRRLGALSRGPLFRYNAQFGGSPRIRALLTWSGRERSSHGGILLVPRIRLAEFVSALPPYN